ncbi:SET1 [Sanghuangporus sanghuang]
MSGKEPPKGPRALRASGGTPPAGLSNHHHHHLPPHFQTQPTASSSRQHFSSSPSTSSSGIGVAPPTGPRSLLNGLAGPGVGRVQILAGPASKAYVNGFMGGRAPPSGPKGKGAASPLSGHSGSLQTGSAWPNGRPPPTGPSALMNSQRLAGVNGVGGAGMSSSPSPIGNLNGSVSNAPRAPISFSLPGSSSSSSASTSKQPQPPPSSAERPPSPSSSPPPSPPPPSSTLPHLLNGDAPPRPPSSTPPPPAGPPPMRSPPPPPPAEVPNDRSPISIKLPMTTPHEPKVAPPPLPPGPPTLEPLAATSVGKKESERERGWVREKEKEREGRSEPRPPSIAPPPLPPPDPRLASLPRHHHSRPKSPPPSPSSSRHELPNHIRSDSQSRSSRRSPSPPPPPPRPATPVPEGVSVTYKRLPGHQHPQKLYTLDPPPPLPPRSSYIPPDSHDFRVLFDSSCDKDRYGETKSLMDTIRAAGKADERIVDSGKGKVVVFRHNGETVSGEKEVSVFDPRPRKELAGKSVRLRSDFCTTSYEYDSNTPGPPPPTNILIFGFSELTPTPKIRQHFSKYGSIASFERELDRVTGGQMGVASIKYSTHEEAKRAVDGEEGRNFTLSIAGGGGLLLPTVSSGKGGMEKDSVKVLFDGEGKLLKLVMGLYDERRRGKASGGPASTSPNSTTNGVPTSTSNGQVSAGQQQQHPRSFAYSMQSQRPPHGHGHPPHLPPHPLSHVTPRPPPRGGPPHFARGGGSGFPHGPSYSSRYSGMNAEASTTAAPMRQPPPSLVRARAMNAVRSTVPPNMPSLSVQHGLQTPETDSSRPDTPIYAQGHGSSLRGRGRGVLPNHLQRHSHYSSHPRSHSYSHSRSYTPTHTSTSTPRGSRSPSPTLRARRPSDARSRSQAETQEEKERKHRKVLEVLLKNGYDHVRIDEALLSGNAAREEDVREFFKGFPVEDVLHDHFGWYITFSRPDAARRAARVLAIGTHTLANRSVSVTVHPPPHPNEIKQQQEQQQQSSTSSLHPLNRNELVAEKRVWKPEEVVEEAGKVVMKELKTLLEKDVMERIVNAQIRRMVYERERERREKEGGIAIAVDIGTGEMDNNKMHLLVQHAEDVARGGDRADGERERQRLKGLSFRKRKQKVDVAATVPAEHSLDKVHEPEPERVYDQEDVGLVVTTKADDDEESLVAVALTEGEREYEQGQQEMDVDVEKPAKRLSDKEERPRKRRRKAEVRVVREREVESEDEEAEIGTKAGNVVSVPAPVEETSPIPPAPEVAVSPVQLKRSLSPTPIDEPPAKRSKVASDNDQDHIDDEKVDVDIETPMNVVLPTPVRPVVQGKTKKQSAKKAEKADKVTEKEKKPSKRSKKSKAERAVLETLVIPPQMEVEAPSVAEVRVSHSPPPDWASSVPISEPPLPVVIEKPLPSPKRYNPLPDSVLRELVEDDEDLYLAKLALSLDIDSPDFVVKEEIAPPSDPNAPPPFRKHVTGSARSEGYYKISHAEKSAYVAQYALRGAGSGGAAEKEAAAVAPQEPVVSSRSNRANARRRAQGLEEMNQLQLAVALSKGESAAATEVMKFNQLQTRKKHLRFARSPIHDWGLYAMERISRGEMVIEYVGEIIRAAVADKREKAYERQGIGSSYLFRIDEDLVVDATKKGNLGRLINHSCDPNCTAKIITINGEKKIVIYAKQEIELGDEITYDYHFPIEQDKIPCLCGSAKCRGFLN